jgi:hypothetical protein
MRMNLVLIALTVMFSIHLRAEDSRDSVCLENANKSTIQLESKSSKVLADKVKIIETKSLAADSTLTMHSVFVDSPSTQDNTHWVIIGEFDADKMRCRTRLSRRYSLSP